jgi:hypothetical protein
MRFLTRKFTSETNRTTLHLPENLSFHAKYDAPSPLVSVDVIMRKMETLRTLAEMKKDARLTIRIPRELKARIEGIDRVYGVALPKIANECLKAFCDYVEQEKQTPTFPLSIGPYLPSAKTPNRASVPRRGGIRNGRRQ